ncbi:MAG: exo-beta-N-acetylmuramidase NamZ domain-containing protein, partial [Methylococcaceae bacterium]
MKTNIAVFLSILLLFATADFAAAQTKTNNKASIQTGAEQTDKYLSLLKNKRIAIVGNQTSVIGKTSLVDTLRSLGVNIVRIFGPEHGFRGTASAGA